MRRTRIAVVLLCLSFASFMWSSRFFSFIDDETAIVTAARKPVAFTASLFLTGRGQHEHPPLSDILLHFWLPASGRSPRMLRMPSVLMYLAGLWLIALSSRKLAGGQALLPAVAIGVFSPFAFHFARIAGWYSFTFLLVAAVTLAWLEYVDRPNLLRLFWFGLLCLLLVYSNYYGWAMIGCLLLYGGARHIRSVLGVLAALLLACVPLASAFAHELTPASLGRAPLLQKLALAIYSLYSLFVSESAAPWLWYSAVPACLGISAALWMAWSLLARPHRTFLLMFAVSFAGLAIAGRIETKRLLFLSPWLIISLAMACANLQSRTKRNLLIASLIVVAAVGWAGIFTRSGYSAVHSIEPWAEVAEQSAAGLRAGGTLVTNSPSLRFALNYALPGSDPPGWIEHPHVFTVPVLMRMHSLPPGIVLFVNGTNESTARLTRAADARLRVQCSLESQTSLVPEPGYDIKRKLFPNLTIEPFRICLERFRCP